MKTWNNYRFSPETEQVTSSGPPEPLEPVPSIYRSNAHKFNTRRGSDFFSLPATSCHVQRDGNKSIYSYLSNTSPSPHRTGFMGTVIVVVIRFVGLLSIV